jgi:hypothetical protein
MVGEGPDGSALQAVMATIADECIWHAGERGPLAGDYTRKGKTREDQFVDVAHNNAAGQVTEFWRLVVDPFGSLEFLT